jgi:hypothetical protein
LWAKVEYMKKIQSTAIAFAISVLVLTTGCGATAKGGNSANLGTGGGLPTAGTGGMTAPLMGAGTGGVAIAPAPGGTGGKTGTGGITGTAGMGTGGMTGTGGMGTGGMTGTGGMGTGGMTGTGGMMGTGGSMAMKGAGACCPSGDCLCHGDVPSAVTSMAGPFKTMNYALAGAGCVYYPTDAMPPFAAVAISDGFGGSGGCALAQTGEWGPLYASWGIVAMIIDTGAGDQPQTRGDKLTAAIAAYKTENTTMSSPLFGKLSGRYGTSGFSMGGGGTTFSAAADPTLKTNVSIMAWTPVTMGIMVPSLFIFGSADTLAGTMGVASYDSIPATVPKMSVTVNSGHAGQPSSGAGASGNAGLAFQKVFLEGDERWRPLLLSIKADATTIK